LLPNPIADRPIYKEGYFGRRWPKYPSCGLFRSG
jgi:hypothetical protein